MSVVHSSQSIEPAYPGEIQLDADKYLQHAREIDITDEQKAELLVALWSIMRAFVDIGWNIDNLPDAIPALKEFSATAAKPQPPQVHQSCKDAGRSGREDTND